MVDVLGGSGGGARAGSAWTHPACIDTWVLVRHDPCMGTMADADLLDYAADTAVDAAYFDRKYGAPSPAWLAEACEEWGRLKSRLARIEREMDRRGLALA